MIRRLNSAALEPACLAGSSASAASREHAKAMLHYAQVPAPTAAYKFKVYKKPEVKAALAALFANKCAYCEFHLDGAPFDVEHYRPKGEVVEEDGAISGGYWWLASKWSNLLPSCQDCNRGRYHETPEGGAHLYGKENLFPLIGTPRATGLGVRRRNSPGCSTPRSMIRAIISSLASNCFRTEKKVRSPLPPGPGRNARSARRSHAPRGGP